MAASKKEANSQGDYGPSRNVYYMIAPSCEEVNDKVLSSIIIAIIVMNSYRVTQ